MSTDAKNKLATWLPLMIAIAANILVVGYGYGKAEQRIVPLEQHLQVDTTEKALATFVTRSEWQQRNETRDREMAENRAAHAEISAKLDRLIERIK